MKTLLLLLVFPLIAVYSQERFEVKNIGFSIDTPKDWETAEEQDVLENIKKFDFSKKQLNDLISNDGLNLVTYTKYNSKKHAGIIPTIKIRVLKTNAKNIESLLKSVEMSNEEAKKMLIDFMFSKTPTATKISDNDAIAFSVNFKLKNAGKEYKINSDSYYILRKGYFISINFIEQLGKEDNSKLFEMLAASIILKD